MYALHNQRNHTYNMHNSSPSHNPYIHSTTILYDIHVYITNHSMRCVERQDKAMQHNRKTKQQHNLPKALLAASGGSQTHDTCVLGNILTNWATEAAQLAGPDHTYKSRQKNQSTSTKYGFVEVISRQTQTEHLNEIIRPTDSQSNTTQHKAKTKCTVLIGVLISILQRGYHKCFCISGDISTHADCWVGGCHGCWVSLVGHCNTLLGEIIIQK